MDYKEMNDFYNAMINADIDNAEDFWEQRVVDIYYYIERNTDLLIVSFKFLLERINFPKQCIFDNQLDSYKYLNSLADYYNEENIRIAVDSKNDGYSQSSLSDISVKQFFSIKKLCSNNIYFFIEKIILAYRNEYEY